MANSCWNTITIEGPDSVLDVIEKRFRQYNDFKYFTQFAQHVLGLEIEEPPEGDIFPWAYKYGTKWLDFLFEEERIQRGEGYLCISADSAWSPPIPLSEDIARVFDVVVRHEFEESGMGFSGS